MAADFFPVLTVEPYVRGEADTADFTFLIANRGATITTPIGWQGFISADDVIGNGDDVPLGLAGTSTRFLKGARVPASVSVPPGFLGGLAPGDYHVGVRLDVADAIDENREDNNAAISGEPVLTVVETLTSVAGTDDDDVIEVTPSNGSDEYVYVRLNGKTIGALSAGFDFVLAIDARGGGDLVTIDAEAVTSTSVLGGSGDDTLVGGPARDRLFGDGGNDLLHGRNFDDLLEGGSGADRLSGDSGEDTLRGGGGNDRLHGGTGSGDELFGGTGDDLLYVRDGLEDLLSGGSGRDRADADADDDRDSIESLLN